VPKLTKNTPALFEVSDTSADAWGGMDRLVWCEADSGRVFINGVRLTLVQVAKLRDWLKSAQEQMGQ
jgi:hypothetical protein